MVELKFDEIGYWSEIKLDIIKNYAQAYATILAKQTYLKTAYIDAFAGAGRHISKTTREIIPGSPLNALSIEPPFNEYYFIDIEQSRVEALVAISRTRPNVHVLEGDCNEKLINEVFPKVRWEDYKRGLCLLDPYGLHLNWEVLKKAGEMKSVEIFLNFPAMDMNRNVFWKNFDLVDKANIERMNLFWGDESWRAAAYETTQDVFGERIEKAPNEVIAEAFQQRLKQVAGFKFVPNPLPMKNTKGAIVYYLFFASHNDTGQRIATDIFNKYRRKGF